MATVLNAIDRSHFTVGISPRGFVLLEQRGLVSREVRGPEPTPADLRFVAHQLNTSCDGVAIGNYLRANGCIPIDELGAMARIPWKGIVV